MKDVNYISHVLYQSKLLTASIKVPIFIEFIIFHSCVTIRNMHCVKSVQIQSYFWSAFSRIRTEYGGIRSISPYSVWMRENTDQKKLRIWTFFKQKLNMVCAMLWSTPDMILRNQSMLNNSFLYFFYTFL